MGYNTREYQQVLAGYEFGRNFDSDFELVTGRVRRKLTPRPVGRVRAGAADPRPGPGGKSTWIHVVRATQFFTNDLYLQVFYQTNSAIDRQNLQVDIRLPLPPALRDAAGRVPARHRRVRPALLQGNTVFLKATAVF